MTSSRANTDALLDIDHSGQNPNSAGSVDVLNTEWNQQSVLSADGMYI